MASYDENAQTAEHLLTERYPTASSSDMRFVCSTSENTEWSVMPVVKKVSEEIERSSSVLSRDTFKLIYNLNRLQPWLAEKQEALENILFLSDDADHFDLIINLTSRFLHIDAGKQKAAIKEIVSQILVNWNCKPANSFITSTNRSNFSDSSENILWLLKPMMSKIGGGAQKVFIHDLRL